MDEKIKQALETITWLGHASFRISGSKKVYIDPWKLPDAPHDADVVFVLEMMEK